MSTMVQSRLLVLSEAAQAAFDKYLGAKATKKRADSTSRKADDQKKEALATVTGEMGDDMRAALPDGRIVQRLPKSMHRKAQPAKDFEWEELIEAHE